MEDEFDGRWHGIFDFKTGREYVSREEYDRQIEAKCRAWGEIEELQRIAGVEPTNTFAPAGGDPHVP